MERKQRIVTESPGRTWHCTQVGQSGPVGSITPPFVSASSGHDVTLECRSAPDRSPVLVNVPENWLEMEDQALVEAILAELRE
jgi:hypothetical protein